MLKFLKFILGFISFIILITLINVSFYSGDNSKMNNINFKNFVYSGSYINNINYLDNIYTFDKEKFNISENNNNIKINLEKGVFILDLNDISKKYIVESKGFNLDLNGGGDIYIDTTGDKDFIFSLNSSFVLKFLDKKSEVINSSFLYPHEWIKFNPDLNFIYKKADLYRIRTTTKNGYFKNNLSSILSDNKDFTLFLGKDNIDLFVEYINLKKGIYKNNSILYNKILLFNENIFPFLNYINKYKMYFVNNSKKAVFLQNNIYNLVVKLIHLKKYDKSLTNEIVLNLNELKLLNISKYTEVNNFILNIYKSILLKNNINNIDIKNFISLINISTNIDNIENYIILKNIYINNDINGSKYKINIFLESYIDTIKGNNLELESLNFFLGEYIYGNLFIEGNYKFELDLDIFKKYFSINRDLYFTKEKNKSKIETSLIKNEKILIKLELFLRNTFFKKDRVKVTNLLSLKNDYVDFEKILIFEEYINKTFELFNLNKKHLNIININNYNNLSELFVEDFLALKNYGEYELKYNKNLGDLFYSSGIGAKTVKEVSKNDIIEYLNNFNNIYFDEDNIVFKDDYFEIKNVKIYNDLYDFNLYPLLGNKLNLFKHGYGVKTNQKTFSYNLNFLKSLWDEQYKSAKIEEKYKFDFKNFFIEKLKNIEIKNGNKSTIKEICELRNMIPDPNVKDGCKSKNIDSNSIFVFKKNILLGEEFSTIKDFFIIKYDNILVEFNSGIYDINIYDAFVNLNIKDESYKLNFYSKYDFKKHIFYSTFYEIENENKMSLFDGSKVYIKYKKIPINDLEKTLEDRLDNIKFLKNIYSLLKRNILLNNFKIEDIFGKFYFKFKTNNKNIVIKVEKNKILSIMVENINILRGPIHINDLKNYINKIK